MLENVHMNEYIPGSRLKECFGNSLHENFRQLCLRYSELGKRADVRMLPFRDRSSVHFLTLSIETQLRIIETLSITIRILESAIANDVDFKNSKLSLIWLALRELGLRPTSNLFTELDETDIIEIYNLVHVQIFRTFNMFKCINYSLDELFSHEWWDLFQRDSAITDALASIAISFTSGRQTTTRMVDLPDHVIEEKFSPVKTRVLVRSRLGSPLFNAHSRAIAGYLNVVRPIRIMEQNFAAVPRPPVSLGPV